MENQIKKLRSEMGLTQEELAKMTGVSRPALSLIENGETTPNGDTIEKLVKALKKDASAIFFSLGVV